MPGSAVGPTKAAPVCRLFHPSRARSGRLRRPNQAIRHSRVETSSIEVSPIRLSSTISPRAIATTRSQHSNTWCMLWLMKIAGHALLLQAAHEADHLLRLLDREMVGRLVEDHHLRLEMHGARDGDALPLAARQLADQRVGRAQMQVDVGDRADAFARASCFWSSMPRPPTEKRSGSRPMNRFRRSTWSAPSNCTGRSSRCRGPSRRAALAMRDRLALDQDLALVGLLHAGQDVDQGRLAGAVVADQPERLAALEVEGDALQRVDAGIPFVQIAHRDDRRRSSRSGLHLDGRGALAHPGVGDDGEDGQHADRELEPVGVDLARAPARCR